MIEVKTGNKNSKLDRDKKCSVESKRRSETGRVTTN